MILDVPTIFFFTFIQNFITGIGLILASRSYSDSLRNSMYVMGRASLFIMAGLLFTGMSESGIPPLFSVVSSNFFLVWGAGEYYQAFRLFDGLEPERRWTGSLTVSVVAVNVLFYAVFDSLQIRILVMSLGFSLLTAISGMRILRSSSVPGSGIRITASLSFWLLAFVFLLRAGGTFFPGGSLVSLFENSVWQTFIYSTAAIGFVLVNFSFLLLCNGQFSNYLRNLALTDYLTGLFNRRAFVDLAVREINRAVRSHEPLSLIVIDADRFKEVNDTYGHTAGDRALEHLSVLFRENVRSQDIIGRIGGDEFAVLLPGSNLISALEVKDRLVSAVDGQTFSFRERNISLKISAGTAALDFSSPYFDDLFARADASLYREKGLKK